MNEVDLTLRNMAVLSTSPRPITTNGKSKVGISIAILGVSIVIIIVVVRYMNRGRPLVIAPASVRNQRGREERRFQKEIRTSLLESLPVMRYNRLLLKEQRPGDADESARNTYSPRRQLQSTIKREKPRAIHTASCSVCIESFVENENVRILPCSHIYHQRCIDPWLLNLSSTCPLCRKPLQEAVLSPSFVLAPPRPARLPR
ncbi:hypothetical protein GMDG_07833 [Pseudogymnoascus destructans 20631-21]|uniref:RING-type domain-containing protein n=1 Tax=Pseudogymnoascus destructans (strain ATCC MYA-4855 / 20631-21) TaxID=658429 RepID=L8G0D6_PSED2|nr:hypothetical protein GMDG_07833 [Pseudogymnoascus destructans 20631-21]